MSRLRYGKDNTKPTLTEYISDLNFYYEGVDVEYDRLDGERSDDGYDRSSTIVNTRVVSVNISKVSNKVIEALKEYKFKISEIDSYCIDRILRFYKVYEETNWRINVCSGYYGEEIGSVNFKGIELFAEVLTNCINLKTDKEKIESVLTLEYGYILDTLKGSEYVIDEIDRDSVKMLQDHYYKKVSPCDYYKDIKLPICVVMEEPNGKYRLIDGYHRFASSNGKELIRVIVALAR